MDRFITVFKTSMKINFSILNYKKQKEFNIYNVLIPLSILLGAIYIVINYIKLINKSYIFLNQIGQAKYMIPIVFFVSQIMIMIFGVFYLVSIFYYSRDYEVLVYLPFKPSIIIGSKFLIVLIYEYITTFPILGPFIYIYGIKSGASIAYWINSIIILIVNPIIPIIIIALLVVIFMRLFQNKRNKDKIGILAVIFLLAVIMIFNVKLQDNGFKQDITAIVGIIPKYIDGIFKSLPNLRLIYEGLTNNRITSFYNILILVVVSVILLYFFLKIINWLFREGLFIQQETVKTRYYSGKIIFKKRSQIITCFIKELKLFFRNPVYIINGMFGVVIAPLLTPLMFNMAGAGESLDQIQKLMNNPNFSKMATILSIAVLVVTSGINIVASSAISREGQKFWVCRLIPASPQIQILAKLIFAIFISLIGIVLNCIIFIFIFRFHLDRTLLALIVGILFSIPLAMIGIIIDLSRPKLNWVNYAEPVKQNLNVVVAMLISFGTIFLYGIVVKKMMQNNFSEFSIYALIILSIIVLSVILYNLMIKLSEGLFERV